MHDAQKDTVRAGDARKAATMLNEGLLVGVEKRLGMYASKQPST